MPYQTNKMSIRLVELAKDYQDAIGRAERAEKKLEEAQRALEAKELEFKYACGFASFIKLIIGSNIISSH